MSSKRVALVAGASFGIGRAIAERLASDGHRVLALARSQDKLAELEEKATSAGHVVHGICADVADLEATLAAVEAAARDFGEPSIFVHAISSRYRHARLQSVNAEDMRREIDVGLTSAAALSSALLRGMARERFGRIVFLGSSAAAVGLAGSSVYCAIKAGLEGLARGIAVDYADRGITANTIALGMVKTERLDERRHSAGGSEDDLLSRVPQRRLISVDEVAAVTSFLVSDVAQSLTGTVIQADAGLHLVGARIE